MSSRQSGKKCVINSCKVSKRNTSKKLFKYPKNGMEMYKKWLETCNLESCTIKNFYICEQHFLPTDLGKKYLKKHAFPRISQCVECIQEVSQDNPLIDESSANSCPAINENHVFNSCPANTDNRQLLLGCPIEKVPVIFDFVEENIKNLSENGI